MIASAADSPRNEVTANQSSALAETANSTTRQTHVGPGYFTSVQSDKPSVQTAPKPVTGM